MSNMNNAGNSTQVQHDDPETYINQYITVIMIGVFSGCGIFGNALVIYVFSKQKQKLSSTLFIITLAVTDFLASLITMPSTIVTILLSYRLEYDFLCKLYAFTQTTIIPFSSLVMAAIAVDRYLIIVYPLKNLMTIERAKRARIVVLLLSLFAIIVGTIFALTQGTYERIDNTLLSKYLIFHTVNITYEGSEGYAVLNNTKIQSTHSDILQNGGLYHHGICHHSKIIFSSEFYYVYQKVYCGVFGMCAVAVTILYLLIYKTIINQRRRRSQLDSFNKNNVSVDNTRTIEVVDKKASSHAYVEKNAFGDQLTSTNVKQPDVTTPNLEKDVANRQRTIKPRDVNTKTAFILFVVAFIYSVAFTPAWLMSLRVIRFNSIVFYSYFIYNVANPVIYAFLNKDFRSHSRRLFGCRMQT